jgi:hypothetical protein
LQLGFSQNITFQHNKNISGTLAEYLDNPNWNFSKIRNLISCGHYVKHLLSKNQTNQSNCLQQWLAALVLVPDLQTVPLPLLDSPLSSPSPLCPDPGRETWKAWRKTTRTPHLSPSEPDRLDPFHRARTLMQHAAARSTRQRRPLFTPLPARAVSWPPLDTAGAPSPAYKKPPFFPEKIPTIPSTSLDNVSLSPVHYVELADLDIPADHHPFPALRSHPRRSACRRRPRRTSGAVLHPRRRSPPLR